MLQFLRRTAAPLLAGLAASLAGQAQTQPPLYFPPLTGGTWATATPASLGYCQPQLDSVLAFAGRRNTKALLIVQDGRLVVERYYGTFTQDSVWYWASAGKSLTATLTGLAQQDGLLRLSDSTTRHLGPGWSSASRAQERQILLRHHLSMTTGLDDTPPAPCTNETSSANCLRYQAPPATRWAYHTGAYRVLQDVLTRASGSISYSQYTAQRLGSRIGMSGLWRNGVFFSRPRDMARFGLFILARGSWNGTPILTDQPYFNAMTSPSQALNASYGYLWWLNGQASLMLPGPQQTVFPGPLIPAAPADLVAALGKNDQKIYVVPSRRLVVVRMGNAAGGVTLLGPSSFDNELWARLMAAFCRPAATASTRSAAGYEAFPNPASSALTLRHPGPAAAVRLLDALGRTCREAPANAPETTLTLAGLAPGLYAAQWLDAQGRIQASRTVSVE